MTDAAQRPTTALAALDAYSDRLSRATDLEHVVDAALAGIGDLFPASNALLLVHEPELGKLVDARQPRLRGERHRLRGRPR